MRIIGGSAKGLPIKAPAGRYTRPTLARVREAVFDILGSPVMDSLFLDLYAGSGSVGLEALSRGASEVLFIEHKSQCCACIRSNVERMGLIERARIWRLDAVRAIGRLAEERERFDIIFADPPYGKKSFPDIGELLTQAGILSDHGIFVGQVEVKEEAPAAFGLLALKRQYRYGDTKLLLYSKK